MNLQILQRPFVVNFCNTLNCMTLCKMTILPTHHLITNSLFKPTNTNNQIGKFCIYTCKHKLTMGDTVDVYHTMNNNWGQVKLMQDSRCLPWRGGGSPVNHIQLGLNMLLKLSLGQDLLVWFHQRRRLILPPQTSSLVGQIPVLIFLFWRDGWERPIPNALVLNDGLGYNLPRSWPSNLLLSN